MNTLSKEMSDLKKTIHSIQKGKKPMFYEPPSSFSEPHIGDRNIDSLFPSEDEKRSYFDTLFKKKRNTNESASDFDDRMDDLRNKTARNYSKGNLPQQFAFFRNNPISFDKSKVPDNPFQPKEFVDRDAICKIIRLYI